MNEFGPDGAATDDSASPDMQFSPAEARAVLIGGIDALAIGVAVVGVEGDLAYANRAAREIFSLHGWLVTNQSLQCPRQEVQESEWKSALRDACCNGRRRLVALGEGDRVLMALTPIANDAVRRALLICGRPQLCGPLELQLFASRYRLTSAEGKVLHQLTLGLAAQDIAQANGVAVSTVRTQIAVLRSKTGASSIYALLAMVSSLPALLPALPQSLWMTSLARSHARSASHERARSRVGRIDAAPMLV